MYVAIRASGVVVQLVRTLPCHARSLFACINWFIGDSTSGSAKNRLLPKMPRVKLLKQVKVNDKWTLATALFDSKGRVRRDHVLINARDETHAGDPPFFCLAHRP